jgi:hypothetical protein
VYAEGGGQNPPYGEDFFQRIVGVHWPEKFKVTGGVFVAGCADGSIFYLRVGAGELEWQLVGNFTDSGDGSPIVFTGSSYGLVNGEEPVFVMVGAGSSADSVGSIFASQDGLNWSKVYTLIPARPDVSRGCSMFSVAWDGTQFWAGGHRSENYQRDGDPNLYEIDMLFNSSDGFGWHEVDSVSNSFNTTLPDVGWSLGDYTTGLLNPHCSSNVVDKNRNNVPDGVYGYDPISGNLVRPENVPSIDYFFGRAEGTGGGVVANDNPIESPEFPTFSVALAGNTWVAGGGGFDTGVGDGRCNAAIMSSSIEPGGIRWTSLDPPGSEPILTMAGG